MRRQQEKAGRASEHKAVKTFWERAQRFEAANLQSAQIVAADAARYPSPVMQRWASMVLGREQERGQHRQEAA